MSSNALSENDKSNLQSTAANQLQTNVIDDAASQERLKKVGEFQKAWAAEGKKRLQCPLLIYQAQYQDGDWNCNPHALTNLAVAVDNLTQGNVRLRYYIADISTNLSYFKPSFVYFTGNKDFAFQESEIKELMKYIYCGGTIWIDSANPGRNTPFDIAVRREFKRVLPDRDFRQFTTNSFRNASRIYDSYFKGIGLCPGINGSTEPIEVITVGRTDEAGVIYTLNGYGNIWEMLSSTNQSKSSYTGYDSLKPEAITNSIKFGYNIVFFMYTRYCDLYILKR